MMQVSTSENNSLTQQPQKPTSNWIIENNKPVNDVKPRDVVQAPSTPVKQQQQQLIEKVNKQQQQLIEKVNKQQQQLIEKVNKQQSTPVKMVNGNSNHAESTGNLIKRKYFR